jgi:uncharacterized protein (TIGR01244 family)
MYANNLQSRPCESPGGADGIPPDGSEGLARHFDQAALYRRILPVANDLTMAPCERNRLVQLINTADNRNLGGETGVNDFRKLSDNVWASPQITLPDVGEAARRGFAMVINNRPDGESPDQTPGDDIAAAVAAAGMEYRSIPITPGGFGPREVGAMARALVEARGPVLAYCRTGTRSTLLWSLVQASQGMEPAAIATAAADAGYDIAPIGSLIETLHQQTRG